MHFHSNNKTSTPGDRRYPTVHFRVTRLLFLLSFSAFFLVGCGQEPVSAIMIEFWAMGREGEVVQELLPAFERLHPDIRVRVQQIPWSAAHEKLLTAYAGGAMPDLFQLGKPGFPNSWRWARWNRWTAGRPSGPACGRMTIFPAFWRRMCSMAHCTAFPGMWIPACCFIAAICWAGPITRAAAQLGCLAKRRCSGSKPRRAPSATLF